MCLQDSIIGGHSVRYPWSAISDWAWYRNVRYLTEVRRVRYYIRYRNKLLSDIRYPTSIFVNPRSAVVWCLNIDIQTVGSIQESWIIIDRIFLGSIGNDLSIFTNENIYFESYYDEQWKFRINHIAYNMLILVITKS